MTYVISDLHGCYDKYKAMLKMLGFGPEDSLYFLGDAIDRGPSGFKILLDMVSRPNVFGILGNHEAMAIDALPGLMRFLREGEDTLSEEELDAIDLWFHNGGEISLAGFLDLSEDQRKRVWDYMNALPLYREAEVGGRRFVLVHGGLGNFSPDKELRDYKRGELTWCRPEPDTAYFPDKLVVVGHTPTQLLYDKAGCLTKAAKFYRTDSFIDIDCGCVFRGGRLGCLCLDTMEEIYI